MKKGLLIVGAMALCAWVPADHESNVWRGFRAPYTEQAAVHFLRNTFQDAVMLSANGAKKDPVACTQCIVNMGRNFFALVEAVFEDQRIEDARRDEERKQMYRGRSFDLVLQERLNEMTEVFTQYLKSKDGQDHLIRILN